MNTGIRVTGNSQIDTATAEMAVLVRDARVGSHVRYREQDHYDEAMRLRDEILDGAKALSGQLPAWTSASGAGGKRNWFVVRGHGAEFDRVPIADRYHYGPSGRLARYATHEAAERAAERLNA